jgi:hypothetical protein
MFGSANERRMTFVMLNPSTADQLVDDPTIRRCIAFALRWNCGTLQVVNLFAARSTDPKALDGLTDPVGPDNQAHVQNAIRRGMNDDPS